MATPQKEAEQTSTEVKPFRFMDLSPELRNKIYSLILEYGKSVELELSSRRRQDRRVRPRVQLSPGQHTIQPAILRICRQVHDESTSIIYANNTFEITDEYVLRNFLEQIGQSVQHLRQLRVDRVHTKVHLQKLLVLLKPAVSLQRLEISHYVMGRFIAEQLATAMGPMMRSMHKTRSRMTGYNMKSIMDVVTITRPVYMSDCADQEWYMPWYTQTCEQAEEYEKKVKELLGSTLK